MAQNFSPYSNTIARSAVLGMMATIALVAIASWAFVRSSYATGEGIFVDQPVPFSHAHHVGGLGIDCRYCHVSVETSAFASIPPTQTCMNCHQQLWTNADVLKPVRESWRTDDPIRWNRVNVLADFVKFNHAAHVNNGIGCIECHGRVDQMPLTYKAAPMTMQWCLDCHRNPTPHLRPADQITSMTWTPATDATARASDAKTLADHYHIPTIGLTNCSTCHR